MAGGQESEPFADGPMGVAMGRPGEIPAGSGSSDDPLGCNRKGLGASGVNFADGGE